MWVEGSGSQVLAFASNCEKSGSRFQYQKAEMSKIRECQSDCIEKSHSSTVGSVVFPWVVGKEKNEEKL